MNANVNKIQGGKIFRSGVTEKSGHHKLWNDALKVLKSMKFIDKDGKESIPPSVKNWTSTITGFKKLWQNLSNEGFKVFLTRNCNQDPIENFFGAIRSHALRSNNPTCLAFVAAYKTLLINNMMSSKSIGSNCEEDECDSCLKNLKSLFETETGVSTSSAENLIINCKDNPITGKLNKSVSIQSQSDAYVTGYILKKLKISCEICKTSLFCKVDNEDIHNVIKAREYGHLHYPNVKICQLFSEIKKLVNELLPNNCSKKGIKTLICSQIYDSLGNSFSSILTCKDHNIIKIFVNRSVKILIFSWCREVNRILTGKQTNIDRSDKIKQLAKLRHRKFSKYKGK